MVIGSSTVGMESARRYSSVRMDAFSFSTWNNAGMLSNQNVSARQGTKEAEGDAAKSNMSAFQRSMNQLTKQFTDIKAQSVTSTKQDKDSMMKIKAQCIDYLIRLLFGRKSLLDDVGSTSADLQNADTGSQLTQEVSGGSF